MVNAGIFHNGATNLPLKKTDDGIVIPDASIAEVHEDNKQVAKNQIEHGILAEKVGFDRAFFTEHHFQHVGAELSTNPLQSQMAVAAQTDSIKLCQAANIIVWHDPVRFAEQTALLDVVSDGRAEIGIGRGYQPRENEQFGQFWGGTVQDQEKNRVAFKEKFEIIKKAWTEELISYQGNYHNIPPKHTKWHHDQSRAHLEDEVTEQDLEDVIDWKEADFYSSSLWNPVVSGGSILKKIMVTPQPVQKPHPQLWEPLTSPRSIQWAARNGVNGYFIVEPNSRLKQNIDLYYEAAEEAGWPDHRPEYDGEPFKHGWDEERQRGIITCRYIFNTDIADDETFDRWKLGLEHQWNYYGPFGFASVLAEGDEEMYDPSTDVSAEMLMDKDVAIAGDADEIVDKISAIKEECGYEDFNINAWFEIGGLNGDEINEQLEHFGENVLPHLEEEYPTPRAAAASDD